jgi:hypothetical protein
MQREIQWVDIFTSTLEEQKWARGTSSNGLLGGNPFATVGNSILKPTNTLLTAGNLLFPHVELPRLG